MPAFTATYSYETDSNLLSGMTFTEGSTEFARTTYGYAANRNVKTDVRNQVDSGSGWLDLSRYQYRYDGDRRRTDVVNTGSAFTQSALSKWSYNSRSEVIGQNRYLGTDPESPGSALYDQNFGYNFDNIGNRLTSVTEVGGSNEETRSYTTNVLNQYVELGVSAPLREPKFDQDGNLTYDGVKWYYTWDAENRLIEARTFETTPSSGDERLSFVYDYMGRRVSKQVERFDGSDWSTEDNRKFVYQGWNLILEVDEDTDDVLKGYLWGMDLSGTAQGAGGVGGLLAILDLAEEKAMVVFYDANGNVTQLYDWTEEAVSAHYEYDPFGGIVSVSGDYAQENVFRFSTKYLDVETALYYYGYRYYSPSMGRWLNRDPIEEQGGLNLYGFVGNDPVNLWDYLGLSPCCPNGEKIDCSALLDQINLLFRQFTQASDALRNDLQFQYDSVGQKGVKRTG